MLWIKHWERGEMVDFQVLFNIAIGAVGALLGVIVTMVWNMVRSLQEGDQILADKIQKIEILVAGQYVTKGEFDKKVDALFEKLDRIELKIDSKKDRD